MGYLTLLMFLNNTAIKFCVGGCDTDFNLDPDK